MRIGLGLRVGRPRGRRKVSNPELIVNGTFDTNTDWAIGNAARGTLTISGGQATIADNGTHGNTSFPASAVQAIPALIAGKKYLVTFTVISGTSPQVFLGSTGSVQSRGVGTHTAEIVPTLAQNNLIILYAPYGSTTVYDDVSVKEVIA